MEPGPTLKAKCVIVGAGVSGLVAARTLLGERTPGFAGEAVDECGTVLRKDELIVLEARGQIGGRVLTLPWTGAGASVDAGAAWVHGVDGGQPLVELAAAVPATLEHQSLTNPWMDPMRGFSGEVRINGRVVEDSDLRESLKKSEGLLEEVGAMSHGRPFDTSLEEGLHAMNLRRGARAEVGEKLVVAGVEYWNGASVSSLSLNEWVGGVDGAGADAGVVGSSAGVVGRTGAGDSDSNPDPNPNPNQETDSGWGDYPGAHALPACGMFPLVEWLHDTSDMAQGCVRFDETVTEIQTGSGGKHGAAVTVRTATGTTVSCDMVLVTVPLGVLKLGLVKFSPPLPSRKVEAMRRLAMGSYKKVWLEFNHEAVFWERHALFIACALTTRDPSGSASEYDEQLGNGFLLFDNLLHSDPENGPPVLEAVLVGRRADLSFGRSDDEISAAVLHVLRRSFPEAKVPEPVRVGVTRWEEDPYSRGAYSFFPPGATECDVEAIAKPVGAAVFFCGEATDAPGQGSLHGAGASGVRAAMEMRRALDKAGAAARRRISSRL